MWKDNLIALREKSGIGYPQIAVGVNVSESTVKRVFSRKKEDNKRGHSIDLIISIIHFLGGKVSEIFEDTGAIIFDQNISALQESIVALTAERDALIAQKDLLKAENAILIEKVSVLTSEIDLLKLKLAHKDELIALHNYYNNLRSLKES